MLALSDEDPYAKWSMIASFVGAGATVLGVILAAVAGLVAYRLLKVESARDQKAELREQRMETQLRRQQASAIGFWDSGEGCWILANHSSLPIYRILVGSINQASTPHDWAGFMIDFEAARPTTSFRGFLGPGQDQTFEISLDTHDPRTCVCFVDNAGLQWFRSQFELTEVEELDDETRTELRTAIMNVRFDEL